MTKFQENFQKNYVHFERRYSIRQRQSSIKHKLTLTFVNHMLVQSIGSQPTQTRARLESTPT